MRITPIGIHAFRIIWPVQTSLRAVAEAKDAGTRASSVFGRGFAVALVDETAPRGR